jgi:hypothetical protein
MVKLYSYSKVLVGLFVVGLCVASVFATEKDKEGTPGKTATNIQTPNPSTQDKVEPLGLESGKIVDKPADLADKIGDKINKFLGKDDK